VPQKVISSSVPTRFAKIREAPLFLATDAKISNFGNVGVEIGGCAGNLGGSNFHNLGRSERFIEPPRRVWAGLARSIATTLA